MPTLLPRLHWIEIDDTDALELDLSLHHRWEVLRFEWFGLGLDIISRAVAS